MVHGPRSTVRGSRYHWRVLPRPTVDRLVIGWTDARALTETVAAQWVTRLPTGEQERFARFRHPRSAHDFLCGRLLVRHWLSSLSGTSLSAWRFREGPYGRPEIAAPETTLRFNLAHSGGVVACILADARVAGVDVEDLARRPIDPALWHRYCAPSEVRDIEAQPTSERQRRFLTYWTLKEAYLKARGLGIAVHLSDIAFDISGPRPVITFRESLAGTSTGWAFGLEAAGAQHLISWAALDHPEAPRPQVSLHHVALETLDPSA